MKSRLYKSRKQQKKLCLFC